MNTKPLRNMDIIIQQIKCWFGLHIPADTGWLSFKKNTGIYMWLV